MSSVKSVAGPLRWMLLAGLVAVLGSGCAAIQKASGRTGPAAGTTSPEAPSSVMNSTLKTDPTTVTPGQVIPPPALGVDL